MDFACFQLFIDKTLQKPENMLRAISKLPINENRIEKFLLVCLLLMLLFPVIVKKLHNFGPHCNISAYTQDYEMKFTTHINFDALISNPKSYFRYGIIMTSL